MPPELAALDLVRDADEIRGSFHQLRDVGLIRYDESEELLQIVGFFRWNSVKSRKYLAGPLRIIRGVLPDSFARDAAALELVVDIHKRARGWDKDVEARAVFMQEAADLVRDFDLTRLFADPSFGLSDTLRIRLSDDLSITLPEYEHDHDHYQNTTTTNTTTTTTTTTKGKSAGDAPGEPPSLPAKRGREVPADVAKNIANMKRITKGPKDG
jgi:hypothetical protein